MANMNIDEVNAGIAKGTINEKVLSRTLEELKKYAYSYLYNLQKDMINISKTRTYYGYFTDEPDDVFSMNDFNRYKAFNVHKAFIHHNNRLKFRRSEFYDTPLTNDIINNNREKLFIYNYLVFINGYLDTSAKIRCKEEITTVCLSQKYMDADLATQFVAGATVDILFLQDSYFIDVNLLKGDMTNSNYTFTLNGTTVGTGNKVFAFVYKTGGLKRCYDVQYDVKTGKMTLPVESGQYFNDSETMNVKLLVVPNFSEHFECDTDVTHIEHKALPMPLPKINSLVFAKDDDGRLNIDCSDSLTEKYPDVFLLPSNRHDVNEIYTLYWTNPANVELSFSTDMEYYMKLLNLLSKYKDGTVPTAVSGYNPYLYKYDSIDFYNTDYTVEKYGPLLYKANKLSLMFKSWGYALQLYYEKLHEATAGYILDLSDRDLPSKLRLDNKGEITNVVDQVTFNEPRYLFTFKNTDPNVPLPYKFWIDGIRTVADQLYLDGTYEYVYFPASIIKQNTVIEIENSACNEFSTTVNVGTGPTDLRFKSDESSCPFTSLFLVDTAGNYIDRSKYIITAEINGSRIVLDSNSTMVVSNASKMQIQPTSDDAANKTVIAECNDVPAEFNKSVTLNNYMDRNLNIDGLIHNIKPDQSRIRIFKHGLLIPPEVYKILFPSNYNDVVTIDLNFDKYINNFNVDYLPEGYNVVYKSDSINKDGIINLEGIINKPFSNKYYDVYVNGVKLLPSQIEKLSNFTIALHDLPTLRKLYIYEKQVGPEVYQFTDSTSPLLSDVLLRTDDEFKQAILKYLVDMTDDPSIPDVDTMFDVIENFLLGLIEDYLEFHYVDAEAPVPQAIIDKYKGFFKSSVFFIDAGVKYTSMDSVGHVYYLSPQLKPEIESINNPYYVNEFNMFLNKFVDKYLDVDTTSRDLALKGYPSVKSRDKNVTFIDGNATVARFTTKSKLLGTK